MKKRRYIIIALLLICVLIIAYAQYEPVIYAQDVQYVFLGWTDNPSIVDLAYGADRGFSAEDQGRIMKTKNFFMDEDNISRALKMVEIGKKPAWLSYNEPSWTLVFHTTDGKVHHIRRVADDAIQQLANEMLTSPEQKLSKS